MPKQVMIVEDNELNMKLFRDLIEASGYRTKVFEFVSDAHTPKNNLIVAQKGRADSREAALKRVAEVKAMFGIGKHYLEGLLDPD